MDKNYNDEINVSEENENNIASEEEFFPFEDDLEEEIVFQHPQLSEPIYCYKNDIAAFCFSALGESHKENDAVCQDRCRMETIDEGKFFVMAIADGVGSCALSDFGADCAVNTAVDTINIILKDFLNKDHENVPGPEFMKVMLQEAMNKAYEAVNKLSSDMQQLSFSFQSTLTISVYDGYNLYFSHAGDDGIVIVTDDGKVSMVTARHKGNTKSSVYPLQSVETWQYGNADRIAAVIMATDGVLDSFVKDVSGEPIVYYPFIKRLLVKNTASLEDTENLCNDYYNYINSEEFRKNVRDDITFAVIVNRNVDIKLPVFDQKEWDRKNGATDEMENTDVSRSQENHKDETDVSSTEELPEKNALNETQTEQQQDEDINENNTENQKCRFCGAEFPMQSDECTVCHRKIKKNIFLKFKDLISTLFRRSNKKVEG